MRGTEVRDKTKGFGKGCIPLTIMTNESKLKINAINVVFALLVVACLLFYCSPGYFIASCKPLLFPWEHRSHDPGHTFWIQGQRIA